MAQAEGAMLGEKNELPSDPAAGRSLLCCHQASHFIRQWLHPMLGGKAERKSKALQACHLPAVSPVTSAGPLNACAANWPAPPWETLTQLRCGQFE